MTRFEVGNTYTCTSACDHNTTWTYKIIARTAKTIMVESRDGIERFRIIPKLSEYCGCEAVYPLGKYSLCPILRAESID